MGSVLVYIPYLLAAGGATGGWHFGAWRYLGLLPLGAGIAGIAWCLRDFAVVAAARRRRSIPRASWWRPGCTAGSAIRCT